MAIDYAIIEYRGFQLKLSGAPEEGWRVTITRMWHESRELNSMGDPSMDRVIADAKRWVDQIEFWRSKKYKGS
jgi:hypothetical protein